MGELGSDYQVLARKWRPRRFEDMVGQEHVLRALTTALDEQRLHHAYLFTGTRGVGKTTVARIFAKALNCEQGVSSHPCGVCSSCVAIDEGRFVDLIEVDAASRTGVDDTRDLLENVQYLPSQGRFKVYLIDEVHMFSKSSFNALLKTLEEPPPHVKFLLATTDPHKLPVTVLSRCLQFHLKALPRRMIFARLAQVLTAENVPFDEAALQLLARAAEGSVRDALSLLDQAIAYGQGRVMEDEVGVMLGLTSEARLRALVAALVAQDAPALFAAMSQLAQGAPDYAEVLAELLQLFHALAVQQLMPEADAELFEASPALVAEFATQVSPDAVQLLYQIALHGRRDLPLAPSPRLGLEMTMMRMLAFAPQATTGVPQAETVVPAQSSSLAPMARTPVPATSAPRAQDVDARPAPSHAQTSSRSAPQAAIQAALQAAGVAPRASKPAEKSAVVSPPVVNQPVMSGPPAGDSHRPPIEPAPVQPEAVKPLGDWHSVLPRLGLKGMALQLAENLELVAQDGDKITLRCPASHASVRSSVSEKALAAALGKQLGLNAAVRLQFVEGVPEQATPAQLRQQAQDARQQQALDSLRNDPLVRTLEDKYEARLLEDTVRPLDAD
ncbi:MAG: DNA polymerase III subunit gamma/tau [Halothiobacillaceae bacterium]|nr:DNA polymerase III subunit gamma/tau [Halothiobacillaceae bacterium]